MIREEDSIISTAICWIASVYPLSNGTYITGNTYNVMWLDMVLLIGIMLD